MMTQPDITYDFHFDLARTGTYASAIDNLQAYVTRAEWSHGMVAARDMIAPPASAIIECANKDGEFNYDYAGAELLTNGDFSSWSAGSPSSWTLVGVSAPASYVTQVGADEAYGGTGTGAVNIKRNSGLVVRLRQTVLTVGKTYRARMNITALGTDNVGGVSFNVSGAAALQSMIYQTTGWKDWTFTATGVNFEIYIATGWVSNVTIDNVSVVEVCRYAGVRPGVPVRISSTSPYGVGIPGARFVFWYGRVKHVELTYDPNLGSIDGQKAIISCECPTPDLINADYAPALQLNVTADQAISSTFEAGVTGGLYPFTSWVLDAEGSSQLGSSTRLLDATTFSVLPTGETTFAYVGDANYRGENVETSPMSVIQDVVAGELGRFYWDARLGLFVLKTRNADSVDTTSIYTLSGDNVTVLDRKYGSELFNLIKVKYTQRTVSTSAETVWALTNVPMLIRAGDSRKITAQYSLEGFDQVAMYSGLPPVAGTDYTATIDEDGVGESVSASISMFVEYRGANALITFSNTSARDAYIQSAQLRGQVLTLTRGEVESRDPASIARYGLHPHQAIDLVMVSSEEMAQSIADYLLAIYKLPQVEAVTLRYEASYDETNAQNAFSNGLGTRITVDETGTGHDQHYMVVGERMAVDFTTWQHTVELLVKPVSRDQFWRLEFTGLSELGEYTRLAF